VNSAKPLDNFPLVRSSDVEEVREAFARVYAKPALVPPRRVERVDTTLNNCRLQHLEVAYAGFGAAVGFEFPATGFLSQLFPICGSGEIVCGGTSLELAAGAGTVIASDAPHQANFSVDYQHLVLRIDARILTETLAAMTGAAINEPLRITTPQNWRHPAAQMLQQYIPRLAETLGAAKPPFPAWWIEQTERLLLTLFLCGHRHNYSHLLEQDVLDAALRQVRQAEEYIEANVERAVTLEELASVTGVSAFSLFSAFRKHRGYSPLEFLAQVRLRAREAR
jgi:AraC-binding-like domain